MTIESIPLAPVSDCLGADANLLDALHLMLRHDVNHVPICAEGRWLGLVSVGDILREVIPVSARVEAGLTDLAFAGDARGLLVAHLRDLAKRLAIDVGRRDLPILRRDHRLLETVLLLTRFDCPLPVLDDDGTLVGMLSRRALLNHLARQGGLL